MAKTKSLFFCQNCGHQAVKWLGKCPTCNEWNTFVEEVIQKEEATKGGWRSGTSQKIAEKPRVISEIEWSAEERIQSPDAELNRVLGGGIVLGSLVLIGGEPGIGKSTLMLQIALGLKNQKILYVSGEESAAQIRMRAERLELTNENCFILTETSSQNIFRQIEELDPGILVIDSIQTLAYRILRTTKNRFGSTSELGIYEMISTGLRQVSNPSEILISQRDAELSGIAIGAMVEGNRPMLIEIQSLVSAATYGTPQRSSTGFDAKRLNMLLAVLEKRGGFRLGTQDVFLNVAGGLTVQDPAIDLAVVASVVSSFEDIAIKNNICFAAEVGLGGEVRAINRIEQRISEAEKLGFKKIFISKYNLKGFETGQFDIEIVAITKLDEMFSLLFGA